MNQMIFLRLLLKMFLFMKKNKNKIKECIEQKWTLVTLTLIKTF